MGYGAKPCKRTSPQKSNRQVASYCVSGPRRKATNAELDLDIYHSDTELGAVRTPSGSQETQFLVRVQRRKPLPRYGAELHEETSPK